MRTWEVRYKLYRRSRRIDVIKVVAETNIEAVMAVILKIWRYPFKLVSVYEVKGDKNFAKPTSRRTPRMDKHQAARAASKTRRLENYPAPS